MLTWPKNNVLAHLNQNKSLESSGLSLLLTHRLHAKTQALPELKALGSRVLNTCPRIPGPLWFWLLRLSPYLRKAWPIQVVPVLPSGLPSIVRNRPFIPSITVLLCPPPQQRESLNKRFRVLAAKERNCHLAYWLYPCMAPFIASVVQPVQHRHYPQVIVRRGAKPSGIFSHFPHTWKWGEALQFRWKKSRELFNFCVMGVDSNPWLSLWQST